MAKQRGIAHARNMRHKRKGGKTAAPDGLDRSASTTLASLADLWMEYRRERNFAERTLEADRWALKAFLSWSQQRGLTDAAAVTKPILESYQRAVYRHRNAKDQPLSVTTQRKRLHVLQRFFAWLCKHNHLPANPAADLELPRKEHRSLPKALSHEQINALLALPDLSDPLGLRDRAILETFYATGIRRMELVNLDCGDLDHERQVLRIRQGKGGKDRLVPMGERAYTWTRKYLDHCRPQLEVSPSERALFLSGFGGRFNTSYLGNWVRKLMDEVDIPKGGSCHLLRHSCATHMLENGADIRLIGQLLGHAKLDTTQIYTEVDISHLREVHARTHPSSLKSFAGQVPSSIQK